MHGEADAAKRASRAEGPWRHFP